jgi:hypothetical protein
MIPKGFDIAKGWRKDYVLKIHPNIYGQKQAGQVWNEYLVNKLMKELKFIRTKIRPDQAEIDQSIKDMKVAHLDITIEGDLKIFLE